MLRVIGILVVGFNPIFALNFYSRFLVFFLILLKMLFLTYFLGMVVYCLIYDFWCLLPILACYKI